MVQIEIAYEGQLRCSATHSPSQTLVQTDAPVDNQGRGESFSPTDLVATALGSCTLTILGIVARERDWDLSGASATVIKHMQADPVRRIGKLEVEIRVPGDFDERARRILERAAHTCPVNQSLGADVVREFRFSWGSAS